MPRSLSSRLIISAAATLFAVSALALGALTAIFNSSPYITLELELRRNADHVVQALRFDRNGDPARVELPQPLDNVYDVLRSDAVYRLLDRQGKVLLTSDGVTAPLAPQGESLILPQAGERKFALAASNAGVMLHVLTRPVIHEGRLFYIQVGRSERFHQAFFQDKNSVFRKATIFAVLIAMLVFIGTVWCTFRHTLRPLRRASEAASLIESNNLNARLSIDDMPQELLPLIDAFNKALGRLELGYRAQQEFLGTVAHELKTPLALIRGEIELDGIANKQLLLKDIDRMARQVHQLLHLAEVSDRKNFLFEEVDAAVIVGDAIEHLTRLADLLGVTIVPELPERLLLPHADGSALFVLVKNLLENALYHAPAGGCIMVDLDWYRLSVRDYGPGIAAADLPFIFRRFWRGSERADNGAGLGLSICMEIALAHRWALTVRNFQPGGAEFLVAF